MAGPGQVPDGTRAEDIDRDAGRLRGLLEVVTLLRRFGRDLPENIRAALQTVPRHQFAPGIPVAAASKNDPVIIKKNERARALVPFPLRGWSR
jgi:hypothetical protein